MINLIVSRNGYVESAQTSNIFWVPLWDPYVSAEMAVKSLAGALFTIYKDRVDYYNNSFKKQEKPLNTFTTSVIIKDYNIDEFISFVKDLPLATCSDHNSIAQEIEELDWDPWQTYDGISMIEPQETVLINEQFEMVMSASIPIKKEYSDNFNEQLLEQMENFPYRIHKRDDGFWEVDYLNDGFDNMDERVKID